MDYDDDSETWFLDDDLGMVWLGLTPEQDLHEATILCDEQYDIGEDSDSSEFLYVEGQDLGKEYTSDALEQSFATFKETKHLLNERRKNRGYSKPEPMPFQKKGKGKRKRKEDFKVKRFQGQFHENVWS